jgi:hypothetical protein
VSSKLQFETQSVLKTSLLLSRYNFGSNHYKQLLYQCLAKISHSTVIHNYRLPSVTCPAKALLALTFPQTLTIHPEDAIGHRVVNYAITANFLGFHHGVNGVAHSSAIQHCTIEYLVPNVLRPMHCLQTSELHTQGGNIISQKTIIMHLPKKGSVSDESHIARWSCSLSCHNLLQGL